MTIEISIVLPMFNEEEVIEKAISTVSDELLRLGLEYEILCINDGSSDRTEELLNALSKHDDHIVSINFSRNFGKESALTAGLDIARGEAVIFLDADLQHPPSLIPKMIDLWKEGYDVVEGRKLNRGKESFIYRLFSKAFYYSMSNSLSVDMRGASDFKLLDRQVVDVLKSLPERGRFFRGLVSWVGFRKKEIEFNVNQRTAGNTTWSFRGLVQYALNNIFAFTTKPLYMTAWLGLITTLLGIGLGVQTMVNHFAGNAVSGFTTVILLIIIFSGIILICIGIVAVYLAKVLEEVKMRPLYIVRNKMDNKTCQKNHKKQTG